MVWSGRFARHPTSRSIRLPLSVRCNFDESGFRFGVGKNQKVVSRTADCQSQLTLGSNTNRETVTVVEAISGDGHVLPPMIIVSGVLHQERWSTATNIGGDTLIAVSDTQLMQQHELAVQISTNSNS